MKIKYLLFILLTIIISSSSCNENNKLVIKDNCDFYVIGVERKTLHHTRTTLSIGYDEHYYVYYIGTSPISNDTVFIISGENNSSKGNNLPEQLYKIGDKFKLLKQNN